MKREDERRHGSSEEKKLELRLGPPGEDNWSIKEATKNIRGRDESLLSLGYFSSMKSNGKQSQKFPSPEDHPVGSVFSSPWAKIHHHNHQQQTKPPSFLQFSSTAPKSLPVIAKESSQPCCTKAVDLQNAEKKAFSPSANKTVAPNSSQKRYSSFFLFLSLSLFLFLSASL